VAEVLRGVLKAFDAASYRATLQLEGSRSSFATNVPVSRGIAPAQLVAGRVCVVVFLNPEDAGDARVVGVH
jgi:hypothetical protein